MLERMQYHRHYSVADDEITLTLAKKAVARLPEDRRRIATEGLKNMVMSREDPLFRELGNKRRDSGELGQKNN